MAWASGILEVIASYYIQPMFLNFGANSFNSDARAFPNFHSARSQSYLIDVWIWWGAISFYSCYHYKALINPTNPASSWSPESFGRNRDFDRLDAFLLTEKGHCDGNSSESTAFFFPSRPAWKKPRFPKWKPIYTVFFRSWRFYQHLPAYVLL